jgi:hypothetical protein
MEIMCNSRGEAMVAYGEEKAKRIWTSRPAGATRQQQFDEFSRPNWTLAGLLSPGPSVYLPDAGWDNPSACVVPCFPSSGGNVVLRPDDKTDYKITIGVNLIVKIILANTYFVYEN